MTLPHSFLIAPPPTNPPTCFRVSVKNPIYQSNVETNADPCAQIILRQSSRSFMKHSYAANLSVQMIAR